jgi:pyrimidine operon attenuation protein/uracil phosphoribosyltransferase
MTSEEVDRALRRISHEILERHGDVETLAIVGIRTRGVHLAQTVCDFIEELAGVRPPLGELDVTAHRDDRAGDGPISVETSVPFPVEDATVILVDDVLYTGRTVRAGLDAISELGRPAKIEFAVLVDRGHREIPVKADYVGKNVPTATVERISVHVPQVDGDAGVWIEKEAV